MTDAERPTPQTSDAVAIVGSGIVATAIAWDLVQRGVRVTLFEKGPDYPYPHTSQFADEVLHAYADPAAQVPDDLRHLDVSGDYRKDLTAEQIMVVGGQATRWTGLSLRLSPGDFRTKSLYGFGADWPISYDDLEPFYCDAEQLLGVSGTDDDNPFAPRRSRPLPLPPFALSYDDRILSGRLAGAGLSLHTTPQARTRLEYDGRGACVNFGTCTVCPIGARYSPGHHLRRALSTGLCELKSNVSVRRILCDGSGRARGIVYQENDALLEREHAATAVVVAAGALESARLLLLSPGPGLSDGLGNAGGQVGRNLMFHHLWHGSLYFEEKLFPGRVGAATGQSHQFLNPEGRGQHGGIKVELSSSSRERMRERLVARRRPTRSVDLSRARSGQAIVDALGTTPTCRPIVFHAETCPGDEKYVALSEDRDRFGDRFARVRYASAPFDEATYAFARSLYGRFAQAARAQTGKLDGMNSFWSGHHHMGTCRMGLGPGDSVVDSFSCVHGSPNLYVVGGASFPSSGGVNPTLTMVALALRASAHIADGIRR